MANNKDKALDLSGDDGEPPPDSRLWGKGPHKCYPPGSFIGLDGMGHPPGAFLGLDQKYHPAGSVRDSDGQYHESPSKKA
jgi:hypothetical protein